MKHLFNMMLTMSVLGEPIPDLIGPPDIHRRSCPWQRKRGTKCRSNARRRPDHEKQRRDKRARKITRRNRR